MLVFVGNLLAAFGVVLAIAALGMVAMALDGLTQGRKRLGAYLLLAALILFFNGMILAFSGVGVADQARHQTECEYRGFSDAVTKEGRWWCVQLGREPRIAEYEEGQ